MQPLRFDIDGDTVSVALVANSVAHQEHLPIWPELEATIRGSLSGWRHNPDRAIEDGMKCLQVLARRIYPTRFMDAWRPGDDLPLIRFVLSVSVDYRFASANEVFRIGEDVT